LGERQFLQSFSLQFAGDCHTGSLLPPAFRSCVFKHRIEVIHSNQSERLCFAIQYRAEYPACPAHCAIGNHCGSIPDRVANLVMISYYLNRISFSDAVAYYSEDKPALIDRIGGGISKYFRFWLNKHAVSLQADVCEVENRSI
jgi:hypothetical protein